MEPSVGRLLNRCAKCEVVRPHPGPLPRGEGDLFCGTLPRVVALLQPWADFLYAFSVFEFATIREIRVKKSVKLVRVFGVVRGLKFIQRI